MYVSVRLLTVETDRCPCKSENVFSSLSFRYLDDKCADNPVTWDAKARLALRDDGGDDGEDATSRLRNCIRLYDEGVNR